jgi:hypothetical protein
LIDLIALTEGWKLNKGDIQDFWLGSTDITTNLTVHSFINVEVIIHRNVTAYRPFAIAALVFGITTIVLFVVIVVYAYKMHKQHSRKEQQRLIQQH